MRSALRERDRVTEQRDRLAHREVAFRIECERRIVATGKIEHKTVDKLPGRFLEGIGNRPPAEAEAAYYRHRDGRQVSQTGKVA